MSERIWKPITPADGNDGGPYAIARRVYGLNGRQYPRLAIAVYQDVLCDKEAVNLTCSTKRNTPAAWNTQGVPVNLLDDAIEMLRQVKDDADAVDEPGSVLIFARTGKTVRLRR